MTLQDQLYSEAIQKNSPGLLRKAINNNNTKNLLKKHFKNFVNNMTSNQYYLNLPNIKTMTKMFVNAGITDLSLFIYKAIDIMRDPNLLKFLLRFDHNKDLFYNLLSSRKELMTNMLKVFLKSDQDLVKNGVSVIDVLSKKLNPTNIFNIKNMIGHKIPYNTDELKKQLLNYKKLGEINQVEYYYDTILDINYILKKIRYTK